MRRGVEGGGGIGRRREGGVSSGHELRGKHIFLLHGIIIP